MDRDYRVTVSAVLARASAQASLTEWVQMTLRAKAQVDAILSAPSKASAGAKSAAKKEADERISEAERARKELERIRERENNAILRDVQKITNAEERAHERAQKHVAGVKERYFREEQRRGEKADAEREARGKRLVSASFGNMAAAASGAKRVAGELVSGFGVSFDLSSAMQRGTDVDTTARKATVSGMGALGKNATEADVQGTISTIRAAGDASKQAYGSLAKGLEDFVSKSSDLETGKKVLADLGKIARATGTDVNDLVSAAGDVNKTLDDTPDKADKLLDIMTLVAAQSAKGSVEVKDFAQYMGRITATAFQYEGTKGQNIGILAGLAQMAMKGGATGAREATNAAQAFGTDIKKEAALKRFEGAGIDVFTDASKTTVRSPEKIITDFLRKSNGDLAQLSKMFQNEGSRRVVTALSSIYSGAGGGEQGIAAVQAEFKKFSETMSAQDVQKRFEVSAGGREAKAQDFQNKLDMIADSLATRVLPAFEEMAPAALKVTKFFGDMVTSAVQNPALAVTAAIVGSIAKAGIGEGVKAILQTALGSKIAGGIAVGVASFIITKAVIEMVSSEIDKGATQRVADDMAYENARSAARAAARGEKDPSKALTENQAALETTERRLRAVKDLDSFGIGDVAGSLLGPIAGAVTGLTGAEDYMDALNPFSDKTLKSVSQARDDKADLSKLEGRIGELKAAISELGGKTLNVNIVGGMPTPGPTADQSGRAAQ